MSSYALYRGTTLGQALEQTLSDMDDEGLLPKSLVNKILFQFDKSMNKQISRLPKEKVQFCATQLVTYRYCDNVWTFILNNVTLRDSQRSFDEPVDKLKIVACDGRQTNLLQAMSQGGPSKKAARGAAADVDDDESD
ncbi:hypothetical protein CAEBREN_09207 [Caenorhabditis brenneri]|uniref:Transcription initiation factor IIA subunit 2 n=1 Tax=Caenorhabditis brenneri TaxID=135651 RepID=G0MPH0_CAEBE|nr:hypothetical protein CAEBREN_09207 [Caenorhabditis brenneri]